MPDLRARAGIADGEAGEAGMTGEGYMSWHEKTDEGKRTALIFTSVDDCRVSIGHITDLPFLEGLLVQVRGMDGHVSREKVIERRIRALRKAGLD